MCSLRFKTQTNRNKRQPSFDVTQLFIFFFQLRDKPCIRPAVHVFDNVCVLIWMTGRLLTKPNEQDPDVTGWSETLCLLSIQRQLYTLQTSVLWYRNRNTHLTKQHNSSAQSHNIAWNFSYKCKVCLIHTGNYLLRAFSRTTYTWHDAHTQL